MVRPKISDKVEGIVLGLLRSKHTYRSIQNELESMGYRVSLGSIRNIRYKVGQQRNASSTASSTAKSKRTSTATTPDVIRKVAHMIAKANPPTQREMASKLGVSKGTIYNIIRKML